MSTPHEGTPPPEPVSGSDAKAHEYVTRRRSDLGDKIVFRVENGGDTGLRRIVPLTYDITLDHPEAVQTAEGD